MRTRYLICYDIADPKRLRQVAKTCEAYGTRLQLSVFECFLDNLALQKLKTRLAEILHHEEDQVIFVPLGPEGGKNTTTLQSLGMPMISQNKILII